MKKGQCLLVVSHVPDTFCKEHPCKLNKIGMLDCITNSSDFKLDRLALIARSRHEHARVDPEVCL